MMTMDSQPYATDEEIATAQAEQAKAVEQWLKLNPLYQLRERLGLGRTAFANQLTVSPMSVTTWETSRIPTDEAFNLIAQRLKIADIEEFKQRYYKWFESYPQLSDFLDKPIGLA